MYALGSLETTRRRVRAQYARKNHRLTRNGTKIAELWWISSGLDRDRRRRSLARKLPPCCRLSHPVLDQPVQDEEQHDQPDDDQQLLLSFVHLSQRRLDRRAQEIAETGARDGPDQS